jgi:predicted dehydrogenase
MWETREVARVARETGVATQMGNIGHSREGIRQTVEWLWDGAIGTVREVHAWVGADRLNPTLIGRPEGTPPAPEGANWDLWIGPREMRPYHPAYTPKAWRDFWAFGGGSLADFGCHDLNSSLWALELGAPETVEAFPAGITNEEIAPQGEIVYYRFGSRAGRARKYCDAPVTVTWYDGGLRPPNPPELGDKVRLPSRGVLFVGDKGKMFCEGAGGVARLVPFEKTRAYPKPAPSLTRSKGHHRDWLDAIEGGPEASANILYGARLTEIVQLGVLAVRTGKRIEWDAETMTARGVPEAEPMIKEPYRKGWEIGA